MNLDHIAIMECEGKPKVGQNFPSQKFIILFNKNFLTPEQVKNAALAGLGSPYYTIIPETVWLGLFCNNIVLLSNN